MSAGRPHAATTIPPGAVAIAAGTPITRATFDHWMYVTAYSDASQSPGMPVVVPTDPPAFTDCIAAARKQIPTLANLPASVLRASLAPAGGALIHLTPAPRGPGAPSR